MPATTQPKIDVYSIIRRDDGTTGYVYLFSTNRFTRCRDAVDYGERTYPGHRPMRAFFDKRG